MLQGSKDNRSLLPIVLEAAKIDANVHENQIFAANATSNVIKLFKTCVCMIIFLFF